MEKKEKKTFTREEVARHNTAEDCWLIIDSQVYDVTKFIKIHPGGESILASAGREATDTFFELHRGEVLAKMGPKFHIGSIEGEKSVGYIIGFSETSAVPYAESKAFQGWNSPYYNESHRRFRKATREFFAKEVFPIAAQMEDQTGDVPLALNKKLAEAGILSTRVGPGKHLEGYPIIGGVSPHEFDYFHELIACEEGARLGCHGFMTGVFGGLTIGLPPVFKFSNSPALTKRVCDEVFRGDKRIALAISEPDAGSDVAGLKTTAVKSADGKYYIVNGMKKWITGGAVADYFTTAVRTSKTGLSMLLIERGPGVTTQKIATSYSPMAGTAYVFFKDVKVPVENLLGKEGNGFACVVANFNHERWSMICGNLANSRLVLEESFKWANQRKVFGKNLLNQAVIRAKLAEMMAEVEACHNWLENITYQMNLMSAKDINEHLAGPIALLKYKTTRVAYLVNDHAIQIFGGRAITKKGMGAFIERNQRAVKFDAILGGSEEIMADLGVRQAMKQFPANARL